MQLVQFFFMFVFFGYLPAAGSDLFASVGGFVNLLHTLFM